MSFPQFPLDYERGLNRLIPETEIQDLVDFLLLFSQKNLLHPILLNKSNCHTERGIMEKWPGN